MKDSIKLKMKSLKADGKTLAQISKTLFDQGVKTAGGKPLGVSYISKIISTWSKADRRSRRANAAVAAATTSTKRPLHRPPLIELLDGILKLRTNEEVKSKMLRVAFECG